MKPVCIGKILAAICSMPLTQATANTPTAYFCDATRLHFLEIDKPV